MAQRRSRARAEPGSCWPARAPRGAGRRVCRAAPRLLLALLAGLVGCHLVLPFDSAPSDGPRATSEAGPADLGRAEGGDAPPPSVNRVWTGEQQMTAGSATIPVPELGPIEGAFVLCSFRTIDSDPSKIPTCQLSKNGLHIEGPPSEVVVRWQVVRLDGARVLRGRQELIQYALAWTSNPKAFDPARSFPVVTAATAATAASDDPQRAVTARLTADSSLELKRTTQGAATQVEWQIVELPDAKVQRGERRISHDSTFVEVFLSAQAQTDRSLLLYTVRVDDAAGQGGQEPIRCVRGQITGPSRVRFERQGTGEAVHIAWFVVELWAGSRVTAGAKELAATGSLTELHEPLGIKAVPTRSVALAAANIAATANVAYLLDSASFTAEIGPDGTEVVLRRGGVGTSETLLGLAWQVWQLPP